MQESSMARFLKGKKVEGVPSLVGAVRTVVKRGGDRIMEDQFGNRVVLTKKEALKAFNRTLSVAQAGAAMKSIRVMRDGRAAVVIGGKDKGTKKIYASKKGALKGIRNYYEL